MLVAHRPSKTEPYNTISVVSHCVTLCMLISAIMLNFPTDPNGWITKELIGLALAVAQLPFWIYLIWVSFCNLKKTYRQSKLDAKREEAQKLHMRSRHEQLGLGVLTVHVVCTREFQPPADVVLPWFVAVIRCGEQTRTSEPEACVDGVIRLDRVAKFQRVPRSAHFSVQIYPARAL